MGRNEIRLRRKIMSAGRIARHRNYSELMERHDREMRIKKIIKSFIYFLAIAFMVIVILMLSRWEKRGTLDNKKEPKEDIPVKISSIDNTSLQRETFYQ